MQVTWWHARGECGMGECAGMPCHTMQCHAVLCASMPCHAMPGPAISAKQPKQTKHNTVLTLLCSISGPLSHLREMAAWCVNPNRARAGQALRGPRQALPHNAIFLCPCPSLTSPAARSADSAALPAARSAAAPASLAVSLPTSHASPPLAFTVCGKGRDCCGGQAESSGSMAWHGMAWQGMRWRAENQQDRHGTCAAACFNGMPWRGGLAVQAGQSEVPSTLQRSFQ